MEAWSQAITPDAYGEIDITSLCFSNKVEHQIRPEAGGSEEDFHTGSREAEVPYAPCQSSL